MLPCAGCAFLVETATNNHFCHRHAPITGPDDGNAWWPYLSEEVMTYGCGDHSLLEKTSTWTCACGTVNGINLDLCRVCERSPQ